MGWRRVLLLLLFGFVLHAGARQPRPVTVALDGSGDFQTVQEAIDASRGGVIRIKPGLYRERITVDKPGIELRGDGSAPNEVILSYDLSAETAGGTGKSASVTVNGDNFHAENLTVENTFSRGKPLTREGSQAVALRVNGDRAVFRRVRLLGYQDTLYANSKRCDTDRGPCLPARQYFSDCYIEGNVDFIFGDASAFFERCEIHALPHSTVMFTAQSKHYPEERSGYVFDRCRLTADPGARDIYLGRPWRAYSTVVFLHTDIEAPIAPAGWLEWQHDGRPSLPTVFYAEYDSSGPGADPEARDSHSHQLTRGEAASFSARKFLRGNDGWNPARLTSRERSSTTRKD